MKSGGSFVAEVGRGDEEERGEGDEKGRRRWWFLYEILANR